VQGSGKGEQWPAETGWRVAYISRWLNDRLTTDAIRLALWPYTPELDTRIGDVSRSLRAFINQDHSYHLAVLGLPADADATQIDATMSIAPRPVQRYVQAIEGYASQHTLRRLWETEKLPAPMPRLMRRLNFPDLQDMASAAKAATLLAFMQARRQHFYSEEIALQFWNDALGFARVVLMGLSQYILEEQRSTKPR
jgi:hypothetical protein